MQTQQSIALNKLFLSPLNQRQTKDEDDVSDLMPSIAAQGLLQRLVVIPATGKEKCGHFGVVAGGRRLQALHQLTKEGQLQAKAPIDCLVIPATGAIAASIAENTQRKALHPADEFLAFQALVESGTPVEDVAASFGVSPLVVRRRLKLSALSPRLIDAYRADEVSLEQLMALTLTDDYATQEALWFGSPEWECGASELRARLTQDEVRADKDRRVKFVGIDAYIAAGGALRQDLFQDHAGYVQDPVLLDRLVRENLEAKVASLSAEGWSAVQIDSSPLGFNVDAEAACLTPEQREPTKAEAKTLKRLRQQLENVDEQIALLADDADEAAYDALDTQREAIVSELDTVESVLAVYSAEQRAASSVVLSLAHDGSLVIDRAVVPRSQRSSAVGVDDGAPRPPRPVHSDKLLRQLSAHRSAALQVVLAEHPHYALAALIDALLPSVFDRAGGDAGLRLSITPCLDELGRNAVDLPESPAHVRLSELHREWEQRLPHPEPEEADQHPGAARPMIVWLLEQPTEMLLSLLAMCVSSCCDLTTGNEAAQPAARFAQAVGLDMTAWWQATAASYFRHVGKPQVLAAIREVRGESALSLGTLKKDVLAAEAERAVAGTGWLPSPLRAA